jgi:hypothetical protein
VDKFKTVGFISAMALRALWFCIVLESDDAAPLFHGTICGQRCRHGGRGGASSRARAAGFSAKRRSSCRQPSNKLAATESGPARRRSCASSPASPCATSASIVKNSSGFTPLCCRGALQRVPSRSDHPPAERDSADSQLSRGATREAIAQFLGYGRHTSTPLGRGQSRACLLRCSSSG